MSDEIFTYRKYEKMMKARRSNRMEMMLPTK